MKEIKIKRDERFQVFGAKRSPRTCSFCGVGSEPVITNHCASVAVCEQCIDKAKRLIGGAR